ncbi:DUF6233 domain-containing protein [Streptomyces sp. NPDC088116]|uniref:DUF6233 domain-containing protein n=1 Tax=Streptomyces sp. NPDC088116 TaxID=3365825 RepID=UPI00383075CA
MAVTLPGGHVIDGHLHARRRHADGQWWYEVSIDVPVTAVQPVDGEDYSQVPTGRTGPEWALQALRHDTPDRPALVLHQSPGCWAAEGRLTPATSTEALAFLKHGWATACDVCRPAPENGPAPGPSRPTPAE